nr:dihydrodipicolinate synthase family protein [uncultured Albidiferax sp.]
MTHAIEGLWPALLMPFDASGQLDLPRTLAHVRRLLDAGCDGVTLFGTTGEGLSFSVAERKSLLEAVLASGVRPDQIVVTISACALAEAIELGRHAIALGCTRQLLMPPFFFNHPREAGVVSAVSQVIKGIGSDDLRVLLYHFPSLSNVTFTHAAVAELMRLHPLQVVGFKDSAGDLAHSLAIIKAFPKLAILVGSEAHIATAMRAGSPGSINGLSNLAPHLICRVMRNPEAASAADEALIVDLLKLLSLLPNMPFVSAYKTALAEQTGDDTWLNVRAPLTPLDNTEAQAVRLAYRALGQNAASL